MLTLKPLQLVHGKTENKKLFFSNRIQERFKTAFSLFLVIIIMKSKTNEFQILISLFQVEDSVLSLGSRESYV